MVNREEITRLRTNIYDALNNLTAKYCVDKSSCVNVLLNGFVERMSRFEPYGKAASESFGNMTQAMACLFAYNNKQFYVYKAIENPNKIGYLSAKNYLRLKVLKRHIDSLYMPSRRREELIRCFLATNGTMASPYKLLKKAFKENVDKTRWLSHYFPLLEDGKKCNNEDKLIEICDILMQALTAVTIEKAPINTCYDVSFGNNYSGSGKRYATSSCMQGLDVQPFYDAFGADGYIVKYKGTTVGRFLGWKLDDGRYYVDRLYCNETYVNEVLAEIDKQFPTALKFPYARDTSEDLSVTLKNPKLLMKEIRIPYTDSFQWLWKEGKNKLFLSNRNIFKGVENILKCKDTNLFMQFVTCEACGEILSRSEAPRHFMVCEKYVPSNEIERDVIELYRIYNKTGKGGEHASRQRELGALFGLQIPVAATAQ